MSFGQNLDIMQKHYEIRFTQYERYKNAKKIV